MKALRLGAFGWPIIASPKHVDGVTLACPSCCGTQVTLQSIDVGPGSGPQGACRLGDQSRRNGIVCRSCGYSAHD